MHRSDVAWKRGSCPTTQRCPLTLISPCPYQHQSLVQQLTFKLATNGLLFSLAYASHGTVEEMVHGNWTCPNPAPYRLGEMLFQPGCWRPWRIWKAVPTRLLTPAARRHKPDMKSYKKVRNVVTWISYHFSRQAPGGPCRLINRFFKRNGLFQKISTPPPMDDTRNPVRNALWVWLEIHKFLQNFVNFNWKSRKTIQIFAKFCNSSRFWISALESCKTCSCPSWKSWNF